MGVLVQIRDVDPGVRDELKSRAAREGLSFNAFLRQLLTQTAATPDRAGVLARIASRSERSAVSATTLIREERDGRSAPALGRRGRD